MISRIGNVIAWTGYLIAAITIAFGYRVAVVDAYNFTGEFTVFAVMGLVVAGIAKAFQYIFSGH